MTLEPNYPFPRLYECDQLDEIPGGAHARYYFPGASSLGGGDGLLVKVTPQQGGPWIGIFSGGDGGVSGILSCPDPKSICVISKGSAYLVSVDNPKEHSEIELAQVQGFVAAPEVELLVFHDSTSFVAYGRAGIAWRSERVSYDGISITSSTGRTLYGLARDVVTGGDQPFELDLLSGQHTGGSYPQ